MLPGLHLRRGWGGAAGRVEFPAIMDAAEDLAAIRDPMANGTHAAVSAPRRHAFDRAFSVTECHALLQLARDTSFP